MSSKYEYLAEVWPKDAVDAPGALWRTSNSFPEYLSSIDWEWHPGSSVLSEMPDGILVPIAADQAEALLSDRQNFVRYWSYQEPHGAGRPEKEKRVYRRRSSPERILDEVFGPANEWVPTLLIREFTLGPAPDRPELIAIDRAAAEQLIHQSRGIAGATEL
jgi:hypothetical protein